MGTHQKSFQNDSRRQPVAFNFRRKGATGFLFQDNSTSKLKTLRVLVLVLACLSLSSIACRQPNATNGARDASETREVTDEAGRQIRVPTQITRIVSLAPNLTEIVYAVGGGERLVGDTTFCDYPPAAKDVAKVGDTMTPSIERIIALRPQLILVSTASQLEAFTKQLEEQHIAVYVTAPHDLNGVLHSIAAIGDLLGERERAGNFVSELQERASGIEESVAGMKPVTVFYQLSAEPLYTAGRDSWITDLIKRGGGTNVTGEVTGEWLRYSDESALAAKPEAIIIATGDSMGTSNIDVAAPLKKSPAVINNRVIRINGDYLSRPGPRLVDGLEKIARALHPEAFKNEVEPAKQ